MELLDQTLTPTGRLHRRGALAFASTRKKIGPTFCLGGETFRLRFTSQLWVTGRCRQLLEIECRT